MRESNLFKKKIFDISAHSLSSQVAVEKIVSIDGIVIIFEAIHEILEKIFKFENK